MKFSEQTQSFYPDDIDYPNIPSEATLITGADYSALYAAVSSGCHVYFDGNQAICSEVRPDRYHEWDGATKKWTLNDAAAQQKKTDDVAAAVLKQQTLIEDAMQSINVVQLKLQARRALTDAETNRLNSVLDYIDLVEGVSIADAPDISWPVKPE